jgi:hypothetical protein
VLVCIKELGKSPSLAFSDRPKSAVHGYFAKSSLTAKKIKAADFGDMSLTNLQQKR